MATLDKVMEMQNQGKSDNEITTQLQNEGVSPTEINDSINQAKVKNAVSPPAPISTPEGMQVSENPSQLPPLPPQPKFEELPPEQPRAPQQQMPEMQQSQPQMQAPQPQMQQSQSFPPQQAPQPQDAYYQETPQAYSGEDSYAPQGSLDIETISQIAEQISTETLENYKAKTGDISSFKNRTESRIDDIDDRLKRIENSIDRLQQAVIEKIGEFGESSAMIHKDLDNLHGTVAKLMNPLIDNVNEMRKHKR